ncbi:MAG: hypothetical protein HETSPECPRED_008058 [Heterodermia speciosa]|uniref:Uncharacterized protein n=1 Tax=Heterodermia speciosa TaxID=116794 RepID=A0A8H3EM07_9LECA|nr:MAG: hypothetical protein HETSPECPRED_008058 [Heterodermia speciosa]
MSASKSKKAAPEKDTITVEADFFEALLAAVGPDKFNMAAYKKMAHFSATGRTVSSFEHFFRDRKKKAIAMLAAEPEDTENTPSTPVNPRKRKAVAGNEDSVVVEAAPVAEVEKPVRMTRKRKAAAMDDEELVDPAAKKLKKEDDGNA